MGILRQNSIAFPVFLKAVPPKEIRLIYCDKSQESGLNSAIFPLF